MVNGKQIYPMKKCFCSNSSRKEKKKMKRRLRRKNKLACNEEFCLVNGGLWGLEEEDDSFHSDGEEVIEAGLLDNEVSVSDDGVDDDRVLLDVQASGRTNVYEFEDKPPLHVQNVVSPKLPQSSLSSHQRNNKNRKKKFSVLEAWVTL